MADPDVIGSSAVSAVVAGRGSGEPVPKRHGTDCVIDEIAADAQHPTTEKWRAMISKPVPGSDRVW